MTIAYQVAKIIKTEAERAHEEAVEALQEVSAGLTPNHIKRTAEWQDAYRIERRAFQAMRRVNSIFIKKFRVQIVNDMIVRNSTYGAFRNETSAEVHALNKAAACFGLVKNEPIETET